MLLHSTSLDESGIARRASKPGCQAHGSSPARELEEKEEDKSEAEAAAKRARGAAVFAIKRTRFQAMSADSNPNLATVECQRHGVAGAEEDGEVVPGKGDTLDGFLGKEEIVELSRYQNSVFVIWKQKRNRHDFLLMLRRRSAPESALHSLREIRLKWSKTRFSSGGSSTTSDNFSSSASASATSATSMDADADAEGSLVSRAWRRRLQQRGRASAAALEDPVMKIIRQKRRQLRRTKKRRRNVVTAKLG